MTASSARQAPAATFSSDWLATRERLDFAARNRALARALARQLPARPRLIDLGAGTGSLFRFLAPLIAGSQSWIFADADDGLLKAAVARCARWAKTQGLGVELLDGRRGPVLCLRGDGAAWRIETLRVDLARSPRSLPLGAVDAVVCSALLDLVSQDWLERLARALQSPFYAALSVDGRDRWFPRHPADLLVERAFRRDQRREKGLGLALGAGAVPAAARIFAAAGFTLRTAPSDWRIPRGERRLGRVFAGMTAEAALRAAPARRRSLAAWHQARLAQAAEAVLAIRIGHQDLLALPPG
jgi:SAM-dependent methyltransferase